jgi:hypothetical protein
VSLAEDEFEWDHVANGKLGLAVFCFERDLRLRNWDWLLGRRVEESWREEERDPFRLHRSPSMNEQL